MKKTTYSVVGFGGLRGAMVVCAALTAGSLFVSCMGMKGGGSGGEVTGVGGSSQIGRASCRARVSINV